MPNCGKVNYKLNYKPGIVLCPRTKKMVWWEDVKEQIKMFESLPMEVKREQPYLQLSNDSEQPLPSEMIVGLIAPQVPEIPFLYEDKKWLKI